MGIIASQKYRHPDLGIIHIRTLSTATRFTARWKGDGLHITVPSSTTVDEFNRVLQSWKDKLLSIKPQECKPKYRPGYKFMTDDWSFEITEYKGLEPNRIRAEFAGYIEPGHIVQYRINVGVGTDFSNFYVEKTIDDVVGRIAHRLAERLLLSQAVEEARTLGLEKRVSQWKVGRGQKRLGCCSAQGRISLSHTLMLLPRRLRRGTITHELAHLTHFDHSPAFYTLWDKYLGYSHTIVKAEVRRLLGGQYDEPEK